MAYWVVYTVVSLVLSLLLGAGLYNRAGSFQPRMFFWIGVGLGVVEGFLVWAVVSVAMPPPPPPGMLTFLLIPLVVTALHCIPFRYASPVVDPRFKRVVHLHRTEGSAKDAHGVSRTRGGAITRVYLEHMNSHVKLCRGIAFGFSVGTFLMLALAS